MARRRNKGSGYLTLRGKTWYAAWHDRDGVLHRESTKFEKDDKDKALDFLEEKVALARLSRREDRIAVLLREQEDTSERLGRLMEASAQPEKKSGPKLGGLVQAYMDSPRRRDSSDGMLRSYRQQTAAFVAWAGQDVAVSDVDDDMADRYARHMMKTFSPNTYNKHLNTLTAVWKAVCRGKPNPWADMPRKELRTHVRRPFTDEEFDQMAAATDGEMHALLHIGRFTALRLGDAAAFRWSYIKDGIVRVPRTHKTGSPVAMPLHPRLAEALARLPRRGDFALPKLHARYMRDSAAVCRMVGRVIEACGMTTSSVVEKGKRRRPDLGFHSLRHTFVSRYIEGGLPADVVRQFVGHSSMMMTEHYTHIGDQAIVDAFNRIGAGQAPSQEKKSSASDGSKPSMPPSRST